MSDLQDALLKNVLSEAYDAGYKLAYKFAKEEPTPKLSKEFIKELRGEFKYTHIEFGEFIDLTIHSVQELEVNKHSLSIRLLKALKEGIES